MFHFQDFCFSHSYTLHEALISSCPASICWKGIYAFASKSGIEILLKDQEFDSLLERGECSLIVGIDDITNLASLEMLDSIKTIRPNLTVKAFSHDTKGSTFHPKLGYFRNQDDTGTLIVGSGNLTLGGLRRNREAFSLLRLSVAEAQRIEHYWNDWLTQSSTYLKDIDHPDVIRKVKDNQRIRRTHIITAEDADLEIKHPAEGDTGIVALEQDGWQFYPESEVLLAEIPRAGGRWNQANFDVGTFQNFFSKKFHSVNFGKVGLYYFMLCRVEVQGTGGLVVARIIHINKIAFFD